MTLSIFLWGKSLQKYFIKFTSMNLNKKQEPNDHTQDIQKKTEQSWTWITQKWFLYKTNSMHSRWIDLNQFYIILNWLRLRYKELKLKVLTHKSFLFKIRFYTPKGPPKQIPSKKIPKKDLEKWLWNSSELLPNLAGSLLLLLIGFLLWLPFNFHFQLQIRGSGLLSKDRKVSK